MTNLYYYMICLAMSILESPETFEKIHYIETNREAVVAQACPGGAIYLDSLHTLSHDSFIHSYFFAFEKAHDIMYEEIADDEHILSGILDDFCNTLAIIDFTFNEYKNHDGLSRCSERDRRKAFKKLREHCLNVNSEIDHLTYLRLSETEDHQGAK